MLEKVHGYAIPILVFGIPVLAGALLFIWREQGLRSRGVTVRAKCVDKSKTDKGEWRLRLLYEVDGMQYQRESLPYKVAPVGVGQRLDVIYDSKDPGYSEVADQRTSGIAARIVGSIALLSIVLAVLSLL
ncbi:hypothetical protein EOT10_09730 [Streptomyces antnestii]|uniref:DUF3592 domain-containing protein n=1 Tax=Streptomyces antnestii TaxID=2494256 RepID=A0A437PYY1_9ACTN|nr:DUF3592 domain-containing protein [Streptomyces sp. San01]RVU27433.1 hypothetical protein EOT10_09730 [Streptomyces sp. San01]